MKQILLILITIFSINAFGQSPNNYLSVSHGSVEMIRQIKPKPKSVEGSYYYNNNWNIGTIKLFSGELIESYPLKYDLKMNQIDIKVDSDVKALSTVAIKQISWYNKNGTIEKFVNASLYKKGDRIGLFSVISEGKISLLKKTHLQVIEANYNQVMDVGSQAKKYVTKVHYYTYTNGKIKKAKNSKRKILKVFKDKADIVKEYANQNNLSFKNDYDLAKIFDYYNSL